MGRMIKCTKDKCMECKFCMNLTGCTEIVGKESRALIACGYILKTNKSRVFEKGKRRKDFKPGYCNVYEKGPRVPTLDDMLRHTTVKGKRKEKRNGGNEEGLYIGSDDWITGYEQTGI